MDLPTYTNIWRIEKRLYKLYDLRLPMPLPIVWIGVFVGVFVPWSLLLVLVGVPVEMPWHVLFLVPPGIVTWLSTRPVIEGKRLTELLESQLRYLGQPKTWCRLAPASEPETVAFAGRVWRIAPARAKAKAPRKARQKQPRREGQRVAGPRQVRPAVAAAAAAAATAPVAAPATTRWGTRRGTAPALRSRVRQSAPPPAPETAGEPVRREKGLSGRPERLQEAPLTVVRGDDDLVSQALGAGRGAVEPEPETGDRTAHGTGDRETVAHGAVGKETPNLEQVAPRRADGPATETEAARGARSSQAEAARGERLGAEAEVARGAVEPIRTAESRKPAAGKPIDTEALRRLRKLAASADAPVRPEAAEDRGEEPRGEDEVARDQHRKGQPPRLSPSLVLSGTQQLWPPLNPDAKPLPRPVAGVPGEGGRPGDGDRDVVGGSPAGEGRSAENGQGEHRDETAPAAHGVSASPTADVGDVPQPEAGDAPQPVVGDVSERAAGDAPQPVVGDVPEGVAGDVPQSVVGDVPEGVAGDVPQPVVADVSEGVAGKARRAGGGDKARRGRGERAGRGMDDGRVVPMTGVVGERVTPGAPVGDGPGEEFVAPVPGPRPGEGRVRRVESVVGRDSGGWRRIAQVVVGGGGVRTDGSEVDEARARGVFGGSRRIVVLGCTGGAGQSTTALMLGHTFARYRDDRVVAVDANTGGNTLTSKIRPETPETLTSLLSGLDRVSGYLTMRGYTTRTASGLEVIGADTDAGAEQRLADRSLFSDHRLGESMRLLDRHYKLAVIDPAAALAARVLPYADQLVLVVPASEEASEAVAMTYEWLDGHGCAELRRRAVMVVNGVSRRSMADVEQAESVASGRCRAIVRVPWEDDLAPGGAEVVDPGQLRAAGRRAYLALAGVVVAGFAAQTVRPSEEELASDPPGTRIGER
ncbi:conjugal transfer protein [Nonomuraea jiangxiensis]|uniref:MinD-like ATPase involved in chromosome partitioning or flagellar assembly n=1 Tax=Nonomuraea jiangxiensis TaxID=633440 RepID=A0A1G8NKP2_9ACTN|nr:conjugal transfer protein [Nonomuraea jiangxiensis]SDI80687.1 MinD-like ATPase involved in chromosome partitioning or flagellar assembly [Nonomuraea jiangxiensis]